MAGALLLAAIASGGAYAAWQQREPTPAMSVQAAAPVPVTVAAVREQQTALWTSFSGRLEAVGRVEIRPRAAGAIIAAHFREGALVHGGDLLFTIDRAPYQAEVRRLEAQLAAAGSRLALAAREQQRGLQLRRNDDLAQNAVDQRVNEFRAASANLRASQAELDVAKLDLGYTEVRAPISGRIGRIEVTAGNLVAAGPTAPVLTTLVSVDPIYASFDADEPAVARALASLPAAAPDAITQIPVQLGTLETEGTPNSGRLQLIDNEVDAGSGTVRLRAVFDNHDGRLMAGQFARIRLGEASTQPVIAIDERAIGTDQDRRFVMVVGADNRVEPRQVRLGPTLPGEQTEGRRIVASGLQPGERIVVSGLQHVHPGVLVAPEILLSAASPAAAR